MVVLGLILLVLVAVLVLAIFVSNPDVYDLSIFGAVVQVTSAGIFITGAITMAVTILALLLLRTGIRRGRERRKGIKALQGADEGTSSTSATPNADSPATTQASDASVTSDPTATEPTANKDQSNLDVDGKSSTTAAEREAMLDEADALTRDEPEK
jgi:hypothetical protein